MLSGQLSSDEEIILIRFMCQQSLGAVGGCGELVLVFKCVKNTLSVHC